MLISLIVENILLALLSSMQYIKFVWSLERRLSREIILSSLSIKVIKFKYTKDVQPIKVDLKDVKEDVLKEDKSKDTNDDAFLNI